MPAADPFADILGTPLYERTVSALRALREAQNRNRARELAKAFADLQEVARDVRAHRLGRRNVRDPALHQTRESDDY